MFPVHDTSLRITNEKDDNENYNYDDDDDDGERFLRDFPGGDV